MTAANQKIAGFTLIELSIVLIIAGLLIGGVLVGRNLINAAEIRSQISQIEKYQTAVKTFRLKYDAMPGDMINSTATAFDFAPRGALPGQGDGNGILEGFVPGSGDANSGVYQANGETGSFWVDLSKANLIDGSFTTASPTTSPAEDLTGGTVKDYFPAAQAGNGNYVYVFSAVHNYFGLSNLTGFAADYAITAATFPVASAYVIDSKIDDGLPQSGRVLAAYVWASWTPGVGGGIGSYWVGDYDPNEWGTAFNYGAVKAGSGVATTGSALTCYDNNGIVDATEHYSMAQNGGYGLNCALSFRFE